jgi:hypothetical protein
LKLLVAIPVSAISLNGIITPVAAMTDDIMNILSYANDSDASAALSTTCAFNIV